VFLEEALSLYRISDCLLILHIDEAADLSFPDNDDSRRVMPGDNVEMVLKTHRPVAAEAGQRFNIREGGRTVATGLVTRVMD
jgi:elongation factor Tu